jgi:hypothetical protein
MAAASAERFLDVECRVDRHRTLVVSHLANDQFEGRAGERAEAGRW